jgi:hypothetical protein
MDMQEVYNIMKRPLEERTRRNIVKKRNRIQGDGLYIMLLKFERTNKLFADS